MTRILLAFLALLGLVAQTAPVGARVLGAETQIGAGIGCVAQVRVASLALAARTAAAIQPVAPAARDDFARVEAAPALPAQIRVPAVLVGIDRSRQ